MKHEEIMYLALLMQIEEFKRKQNKIKKEKKS